MRAAPLAFISALSSRVMDAGLDWERIGLAKLAEATRIERAEKRRAQPRRQAKAFRPSKYMPHQGERECARRRRQIFLGQIKVSE